MKLMNISNYRKNSFIHFYNHVEYTLCPFLFSVSVYITFVYLLLTLNYFSLFYYLMIFSTIFIVVFATSWIVEIYNESVLVGQYTTKVYGTILVGFCLFVLTELLIFFGFFWALFDRYFNVTSVLLSNYTYFVYLSEGISLVKPLQGLLCLYFSGSFCNLAHYHYFYEKNISYTVFCLYFSILLGTVFLYIQYQEFNHLMFNINDHVIDSCFYLLAGFHGFHVTIGLYFLITQYDRFVKFQFTASRHLGYMLSMIYWHFVDIVWFFLFYVFYILVLRGTSNFDIITWLS